MNTAALIHFPKPQDERKEARKNMYSDKFENGYVMSSRLYRKEVWPFLSDAARNVYAELENRINGHNKESDFVSYSQLQGGELKGSRQLGRKTVSAGIKELIEFGVISVLEAGKQGVKKYRLNDISLVDRFTKGTSSPTTPVHYGNQDRFTKGTKTGSPSELTIDNKILIDEEEESTRKVAPSQPQNRPLNFVQYHSNDRVHVSLLELTRKYPAQLDFQNQAKTSFPDHTADQIFAELKKLAQWSLDKSKQTPQGWMNTWLKWMQKVPTATEVQKSDSKKSQASNNSQPAKKPRHRYGQGVVGGSSYE